MGARLPWPLPALLAWAASWSIFLGGLRWLALSPVLALLLAAAVALGFSLRGGTRWRQLFIAWGFPLSLAASGLIGDVPGWAWLLPLGLLAVMYPVRTWTDAPLFPTPVGALQGLSRKVPLPPGACVLDVGCGLGDGLRELHREYPGARVDGIEWSWPLVLASAVRARFARVRRADMWQTDWSPYRMVYLFQRPETMARAAGKAQLELRPGSWLVSLEFAVPGRAATHVLHCADGRRVWLYRIG
ncbi:class I SAM-dependent methyltransferase [Piscinibacter sp. XHJ-5]|uniref:class I SAM-dependent methyltransferase n=1 Tax=Piscinibacter sp. XHJ-5 TaxID=3037797 RepID=UPI002453495A|nr:class I SAM-dependent methyltransferase [Piscinibacter sp. XHJ-5]